MNQQQSRPPARAGGRQTALTPGQGLVIPDHKKIAARFNSRRVDHGMQFARELQHLEKQIQTREELQDCEPASFGHVLLEAAALGTSLHPSLGHAYVVPYYDKTAQVKRAQLSIGYRGMEAQVLAAGTVSVIQADLVCQNDPVFEQWIGDDGFARIRHQKARTSRGHVTHAYCIAHFTGGGFHVETMEEHELRACEKAASSRNAAGGAVWRGPFRGEMQKKAVVRRAWKHWPKDAEGRMERIMTAIADSEPMDFDAAAKTGASDDQPLGGSDLCLSEDQVRELEKHLAEFKLPDELIGRWLQRLAEVNGRATVQDLPASKFEQFKRQLGSYARNYHAQKEAKQ